MKWQHTSTIAVACSAIASSSPSCKWDSFPIAHAKFAFAENKMSHVVVSEGYIKSENGGMVCAAQDDEQQQCIKSLTRFC